MKIMAKIRDLTKREKEVLKLIAEANKSRAREHKEVNRRLNLLEKKD